MGTTPTGTGACMGGVPQRSFSPAGELLTDVEKGPPPPRPPATSTRRIDKKSSRIRGRGHRIPTAKHSSLKSHSHSYSSSSHYSEHSHDSHASGTSSSVAIGTGARFREAAREREHRYQPPPRGRGSKKPKRTPLRIGLRIATTDAEPLPGLMSPLTEKEKRRRQRFHKAKSQQSSHDSQQKTAAATGMQQTAGGSTTPGTVLMGDHSLMAATPVSPSTPLRSAATVGDPVANSSTIGSGMRIGGPALYEGAEDECDDDADSAFGKAMDAGSYYASVAGSSASRSGSEDFTREREKQEQVAGGGHYDFVEGEGGDESECSAASARMSAGGVSLHRIEKTHFKLLMGSSPLPTPTPTLSGSTSSGYTPTGATPTPIAASGVGFIDLLKDGSNPFALIDLPPISESAAAAVEDSHRGSDSHSSPGLMPLPMPVAVTRGRGKSRGRVHSSAGLVGYARGSGVLAANNGTAATARTGVLVHRRRTLSGSGGVAAKTPVRSGKKRRPMSVTPTPKSAKERKAEQLFVIQEKEKQRAASSSALDFYAPSKLKLKDRVKVKTSRTIGFRPRGLMSRKSVSLLKDLDSDDSQREILKQKELLRRRQRMEGSKRSGGFKEDALLEAVRKRVKEESAHGEVVLPKGGGDYYAQRKARGSVSGLRQEDAGAVAEVEEEQEFFPDVHQRRFHGRRQSQEDVKLVVAKDLKQLLAEGSSQTTVDSSGIHKGATSGGLMAAAKAKLTPIRLTDIDSSTPQPAELADFQEAVDLKKKGKVKKKPATAKGAHSHTDKKKKIEAALKQMDLEEPSKSAPSAHTCNSVPLTLTDHSPRHKATGDEAVVAGRRKYGDEVGDSEDDDSGGVVLDLGESSPDEPAAGRRMASRRRARDFPLKLLHELNLPSSIATWVPAANCSVGIIERRFLKLQELGAGVSGTVWEVVDKKTKEKGALKSIPRSKSWAMDVFEGEAKFLSRVEHPGVIRVLAVYIDADFFHIVTELGVTDLFKRVKATSRLSEKETRHVLKRTLECVAFLHKHNIVHRDLKPENTVFIDSGPLAQPKIIDFGDALVVNDADVYKEFVGTQCYLSPERFRGHKGWELKASDVWAVGVMAFEISTGKRCFYGRDKKHVMEKISKGTWKYPRDLKPSDLLCHLIESTLIVDDRQRPTADYLLRHPFFTVDHAAFENSAEYRNTLLESLRPAGSRLRKGASYYYHYRVAKKKGALVSG